MKNSISRLLALTVIVMDVLALSLATPARTFLVTEYGPQHDRVLDAATGRGVADGHYL